MSKTLPVNPRYGLPALSWSDVVVIEQDVDRWLRGIKFKNRAMEYGTHVHKLIEKGHLDVPRLGNPEQVYAATIPTGRGKSVFMCVGKIDDSNDDTILDYKTCKTLWTQKQAEEHDQLKVYAFLRWKATGKRPTKGMIVALETEPHEDSESHVLTGNMRVLTVQLKLKDLLKVQARFQHAYWKVLQYGLDQ